MSINKIILGVILTVATGLTLVAEPEVTDVVAKQRYPWNGLVDISCRVTGINGTTNGLKFTVAAVMPNAGNARPVSSWVMQNGARSTDRQVHTNGNYRLLWDATADLGRVTYDNIVVRVNVVGLHDRVQLWEGGPYWADTNIGAENPEDYGYYFWWGDTVGYKRENNAWVATDGSSSNFSFDSGTTPTWNKDITTLQSEGWITADSILVPEHDAAHVHWGGAWRMPTIQELSDLNSKCDWTWTTKNGVRGYVVHGRDDYASNSIFLPAAGCGHGTSLDDAVSFGYYCSSVPSSDYSYRAWLLHFNSSGHGTDDYGPYRNYGQPVRPVQGFTE